jgi:hypothetical protein
VNSSNYPELNQPLPRQTAVGADTVIIGAILVIFFVVLMYLAVVRDLVDARDKEILKSRGVATQGTIESLRPPSRKGTIYRANYAFTPHSGSEPEATIRGASIVSHAEYVSLAHGQSVPVLYDPQNTERSSLNLNDDVHTSDPYQNIWNRPLWYGLILIAGFGVSAGMGISRYRKEKQLMSWGSIAQARVVDEQEYAVRHGRQMVVTYEFTDAQGNKITGTQKNLPTRDTASEIWRDRIRKLTLYPVVLFDPTDGVRNILYLPDWGFCRIRWP